MKKNHLVLPPKGVPLSSVDLTSRFRSHLKFHRSWVDEMADFLTDIFGTVVFLLLNIILFTGWLMLNTGMFGYIPFDPSPFVLLTTIVSLEAIFLSIVVLISQNRQSKIADLRQKLDFEINVRSEQEITKVLMMIEDIQRHLGMPIKNESELEDMKRAINLQELQEDIFINGTR